VSVSIGGGGETMRDPTGVPCGSQGFRAQSFTTAARHLGTAPMAEKPLSPAPDDFLKRSAAFAESLGAPPGTYAVVIRQVAHPSRLSAL
jgi:hypothetical protein